MVRYYVTSDLGGQFFRCSQYLNYIASTGKDLEGSGPDLLELLSSNVPGGNNEKHVMP
jgi:hypothetical protein